MGMGYYDGGLSRHAHRPRELLRRERIEAMTPDIEITEDSVTIRDSSGVEVVHWVIDEWIEDPTVAISIMVAIKMAYENGVDAIKEIIGRH